MTMYNIDQVWIDRLNNLYWSHGTVLSGQYDGQQGTLVFEFEAGETDTINFSYEGTDKSHFIASMSHALSSLIIMYNFLHADRTQFINSVSSGGIIDPAIIAELTMLFSGSYLQLTGTYDGQYGVVSVVFPEVQYNVAYSYVGDVYSSYVEVLTQAIAYALQQYNYSEWPIPLVNVVTDKVDIPQAIVTLTAPQSQLNNIFDNVDASGFPTDGSIGR